MHKMAGIMDGLRSTPPAEIADRKVVAITDVERDEKRYADGRRETVGLPRSNVLIFDLEGGFRAIARPSGTEPKLKCYLTAVGADRASAERESERLTAAMTELIERF